MSTIASLLAKLSLDHADFDRGIEAAITKTDALSGSFVGLATVGKGLFVAGLAVAAGSAIALGVELTKDVGAASKAQDVMAQFNSVLISTGGWASKNADMLIKLSKETERLTKFDDEAALSAETVLLQFTKIGKEVFPDALKLTTDLATRMGIDLPSAAQLLGRALGDPAQGIGRMNMAFRLFSDEQVKAIEKMGETGQIAKAQGIIMDALRKKVGGAAEAAGNTASGLWAKLQNKIDDIRETIGGPLLGVLAKLLDTFNQYIDKPEVQQFFLVLGERIAVWAQQVINWVPQAFKWIQLTFGWILQNQGLIVSAIAVVSAALLSFFITMAAGAIAAAPAFIPVTLVIIGIGLAAYWLYQAWLANFGGIQQVTKRVVAFLLDMFFRIRFHLVNALPKAIAFLKDRWEKDFLPPIQNVILWVEKYLLPVFKSVGNFIGAVLTADIKIASIYFGQILFPAIMAVYRVLAAYLWPILQVVGKFLVVYWTVALINVGKALDWLTRKVLVFNSYLSQLKIPSWLTPGSPTPLELGVLGIASAMNKLESATFPVFNGPEAKLNVKGVSNTSKTINLTIKAQDVTMEKVIKVINDNIEEMTNEFIKAVATT